MVKDRNAYRILVIEDNPGDFILIEDFLLEQIAQPDIVHVKDFIHSAILLSATNSPFDVILMDLNLSDKSGQDLVTAILEITSSCPVIILTGFTDIDFSVRSISLGISDYLLKEELNASSLYKSIVYCMERKRQLLQLKESENRYSDLFHLSPQPMCVFDPETLRFVQVNKAAIAHYGFSEAELLTMTVRDILVEEKKVGQKKTDLVNILAVESLFKGRFRHLTKSKQVIDVDVYSNPITLNGKLYQSVIAIDVTEKIIFEHKINRAIIKTQEDERYEIGSELHDNVCQLLAASLMSVSMLKRSLSGPLLKYYDQCKNYLNLASSEIRNLSHRLAPAFFGDSTLEKTFRSLLDSVNIDNKHDICLSFDNAVSEYGLPREIQLNLYRILQEQLGNVSKYARATNIIVRMQILNNTVIMRVSDNGVGFDLSTVKAGIGLANMKRRTELFSGQLEIITSPGNGCEITVAIPLEEPVVV